MRTLTSSSCAKLAFLPPALSFFVLPCAKLAFLPPAALGQWTFGQGSPEERRNVAASVLQNFRFAPSSHFVTAAHEAAAGHGFANHFSTLLPFLNYSIKTPFPLRSFGNLRLQCPQSHCSAPPPATAVRTRTAHLWYQMPLDQHFVPKQALCGTNHSSTAVSCQNWCSVVPNLRH